MLELIDTEIYENDELKHWGILGMHWGVRRFQNEDGSLTPEGRERYGVKTAAETKKLSYSQEYEVLKNKKKRTKEEEDRYALLDLGKTYFEKCYLNKNYEKDIHEALGDKAFNTFKAAGENYLMSTNYGKHATNAELGLGVVGLAGGAALSIPLNQFLAANTGYVIPLIGLSTGYIGGGVGLIAGAKLNQLFDEKQLMQELQENAGKYSSSESLGKSVEIVKKIKEEEADYFNKNVLPLCIAYDSEKDIAAVSTENEEAYQKAMKEYNEYSKSLVKKYRKELKDVGFYA